MLGQRLPPASATDKRGACPPRPLPSRARTRWRSPLDARRGTRRRVGATPQTPTPILRVAQYESAHEGRRERAGRGSAGMPRLLHMADVHLGARHDDLGDAAAQQRERQFAAYRRAVDIALERAVDLVLISGDLF